MGDELYGQSLASAMRSLPGVACAELFGPTAPPKTPFDVAIHLNDTAPDERWAKRHVLYLQNGWGQGSDRALVSLRRRGYDGYAFISHRLLEAHRSAGYQGLFLPFGVETSLFRPGPRDPSLACEVAYVGNDIKGRERSTAHLLPAMRFDFALYGSWALHTYRLRRWKNWLRPRYQREFSRLSRGRIAQERLPALYRSAIINLNCTLQDCVDWDVITLRTLEVLASGGFLVSDHVPAAERLLGGYAAFSTGGDHLVNTIEHWLTHDAERAERARAGADFVARRFSIEASARHLYEYLEGLR